MDFAQAMKESPESNVLVGQLQEADLAEADRIFRLAFGTFLGLPNPIEFAAIPTVWLLATLPYRHHVEAGEPGVAYNGLFSL